MEIDNINVVLLRLKCGVSNERYLRHGVLGADVCDDQRCVLVHAEAGSDAVLLVASVRYQSHDPPLAAALAAAQIQILMT